jgi:hypothetical protein
MTGTSALLPLDTTFLGTAHVAQKQVPKQVPTAAVRDAILSQVLEQEV